MKILTHIQIFHTISEIKTGDARSYALIQFDLHCFDENILSSENSLLQVLRKDLIISWN